MATDAPFWREVPKFSKVLVTVAKPTDKLEMAKLVKQLRILERLHLNYAIPKGSGKLAELTTYAIRDFASKRRSLGERNKLRRHVASPAVGGEHELFEDLCFRINLMKIALPPSR